MGLFLSKEEVHEEVHNAIEQAKVQLKAGFDERISQMESTLLAEIQKGVQQHTHPFPPPPPYSQQITQLKNRVDYFADQHTELTQVLNGLKNQIEGLTKTVAQLTTTTPEGEPKQIHEVISTHTKKISGALQDIQTAHSQWLAERSGELDEARRTAAMLQSTLDKSRQMFTPGSMVVEVKTEPLSQEEANHKTEEPKPLE